MRSRIERRRLELEDARLTVGDPATLRLLEQTVESTNTAPGLLRALHAGGGAGLRPRRRSLTRLSSSPLAEVRATVYDLARTAEFPGLLATAILEIQAQPAIPEPRPR